MSHNLFGFSTKAFEQFIQAVASHVIGPGILIFGSGPDGGREATFDGKIPFPFTSDQWDGYGVIQAKCKEKSEGTELDQEWALKQLRRELEDFATKPKRKHKPQYYIFATNVVLTPVAISGGKDLAEELLHSFRDRLPLKDFRIWDRDQLCNFLDVYSELRRRFSAYTSPVALRSIVVA